jgi:hypothetical protein
MRGKIHISEQTASYIMRWPESQTNTSRRRCRSQRAGVFRRTGWRNKTPAKAIEPISGSEADDAEVQDNLVQRPPA